MQRTRVPARAPARQRTRLVRLRPWLSGGGRTTMYVASYPRSAYAPRVALLERPTPLARWCAGEGVGHAVVGGFFARPQYAPLGQLRVGGAPRASVAFDPPWGDTRACVHIGGDVRIARRDALAAEPGGDLLQAGPLLVDDGRSAVAENADPEGFSAASHQFDSDITDGRYPRAALALTDDALLTVACDGRTREDAGMTLAELAEALIGLGARAAINLDGGGSASLVYEGRLRNRPREEHGVELLGGRPVVTAIMLEAR